MQIAQGDFCDEDKSVPPRRNPNCKIHWLGTPWPSTFGAENSHSWAASSATRAKYLLGPRVTSFVSVTFPAASTSTRTRTFILPSMVARALAATFGGTCFTTDPCAEAAFDFFLPFAFVSDDLGDSPAGVSAVEAGV